MSTVTKETAKTPISYVTGKFERFSYGFYFVGQLLFYGIVTGFLSLYLTESGVPALVISGIYAIAKVWDAINDPIFGVIVDKVNLKKGKYIPWVRLSSFIIPLATIFMFAMPSGASIQVKTIWAVLAYVLWDTSYTLCDVPIFALATSMTDNIKERDKLYMLNRLFTFFGTVIVLVAVPMLYPNIGWTATAIILGVVGMATMLPIGFTAKERYHLKKEEEESPKLKTLVKYLFSNKFLLIFNGALIVNSLTNTGSTVANYVAIYCLGGPEWITIVSLVAALPMLISILITQQIIKTVDKRTVFLVSSAALIVLNVLSYFAGYENLTIYFTLGVIKAIFTGAVAVLLILFTADCAEYGHFVTGERAQGVAFSIQTFTVKLTTALSGAMGMLVLGLVGFVSGEGAPQSAETIEWIWRLSTLVPTVSATAGFLILLFAYQLRTPDVNLMMKANAGEISRAEAEAGFSRKYF